MDLKPNGNSNTLHSPPKFCKKCMERRKVCEQERILTWLDDDELSSKFRFANPPKMHFNGKLWFMKVTFHELKKARLNRYKLLWQKLYCFTSNWMDHFSTIVKMQSYMEISAKFWKRQIFHEKTYFVNVLSKAFSSILILFYALHGK